MPIKLGKRHHVLDDGFVIPVDVMGDDAAICQAARISYGAGTKSVSDDRQLIRYLMRHRHTSPFEMCEIKFHVRVPMDCWRQWIRQRSRPHGRDERLKDAAGERWRRRVGHLETAWT